MSDKHLTLQRIKGALGFGGSRLRTASLTSVASLLILIPLPLLSQYHPLPVHPDYRGPSGEEGQIILDGLARRVTLFHGRVDDEADWHIYIGLDPKTTTDLRTYLWQRGHSYVSGERCLSDENCNLQSIYSEVMVCDRHRSTVSDEYFYSADFTLPFHLTQPAPERRPVLVSVPHPHWTGEHPAWDLGIIAMVRQGPPQHDFSADSRLIGGRVYLQGPFVDDAEHRACVASAPGSTCAAVPIDRVLKTNIEIHPLDSAAFVMDQGGSVISAKPRQQNWPTQVVKWRIAFFANSKYHRINGSSFMKRSRSTTWYLELPSDAYNSWGELHTSIEVSEERRRLWNGWKNTMYSDRGVQSYAPWAIVVDPKDGRKKLRVTATMKKADQWGGLAVRDYTVRVTLRSRPDLGIRTGGSTFADAQFSLGAVARQTVLAGSPAVYLVRAHVQGPVPLQLRFHGSAGGAGWTARYFDAPMGGNDITSQITGAGWLSTLIQGGASTPEIRVEVTPSTGISTGAERLIRVWATSANGAAGQDVVESLTKVGTPEKPIP